MVTHLPGSRGTKRRRSVAPSDFGYDGEPEECERRECADNGESHREGVAVVDHAPLLDDFMLFSDGRLRGRMTLASALESKVGRLDG